MIRPVSGEFSADPGRARAAALRLLRVRPRSVAELTDKLSARGFVPEVVLPLINGLLASGFLDDAAFARAWAQGRLQRYGRRRVMRELEAKGISRDIIDHLWAALGHDEAAAARAVAERRAHVYAALAPETRRRRLTAYLLRRGFSSGVVAGIVQGRQRSYWDGM